MRARRVRTCGTSSARALLRMRTDERMPKLRLVAEPFSVIPISRFQTAHLVPAARRPRPGFASLLRSPVKRGGRSADPPPLHPHVASGCLRLLQGLIFLRLRRPHAASSILSVHRLNRDRAQGKACALGTSFPPPSYEPFAVKVATPMAATSFCSFTTGAKAGS